jgi:predicted N-acetyltransferase YhbS
MDHIMDFLAHDSVAPTEVPDLLDLCFGPARHRRTAALLRLGAPRIEEACFVALDGDTLVGSVEVHLLKWRHPRGTRPMPMLGPLVSHPARRGERIGARLMDLALAEIDKRGLPVMLLGDAPYYGRWGFSARHTSAWMLPGPFDPERLLLRARDGHRLQGPASLSAPGRAVAAA